MIFFKSEKIVFIDKVRKTQHFNLKFGHTWGKILLKTYKKNTLALRGFETSVEWGAITMQWAKNDVKP